MAFKIDLGSKVRDKTTGFTGIVVCRTEWLYGCLRYSVQPQKLTKDGSLTAMENFDEDALVVLGKPTKKKVKSSGGPKPSPTRPGVPTRR